MSTPLPVLPPIEDLFIPDAIDFNIKNNPKQPFFTFAEAKSPNGLQVITHLEFGRAAHRVAHALRPNRSGEDGQIVAIIALSDSILYQTIVAGCIIAGLVPFPISPRNSPAAVVDLIEKTSCNRLITTNITLKALIDGIRAHIMNTPLTKALRVEEVPSFAVAYPNLGHEAADHPFEPYPRPSKPILKDDTCIILHSSGSTGFPKPIPQTHQAWINWALLPGVTSFRDYTPRLVVGCMVLPAFHTFGLYMQLLNPIYGIVSIALYPPTATAPHLLPVTPSPQNILEHLQLTKSTSIIAIPMLLQVWSNIPVAVKFLSTLEFVGYSGGSLAPKLGKQLVEGGVQIYVGYGATEIGAPGSIVLRKGKDDWEYMQFSDRTKIRWVPQGDGTFECHFLAWEKHTPMVLNLPDVKGYATADLWVPHPTKKDLWKIVGRIDDVIVHSSGEKTVPGPMEDIIMSDPSVQCAVMFGRERDQAGVLIELKPGNNIDVKDHKQLGELRTKLWPTIEEANNIAPAFSKIYKEMILITSDQKPLPRTGKGTVMRKAALAVYDDEIVALYETLDSNIKVSDNVAPPASWVLTDVQAWIVEQAADLLSGRKVFASVDLFEQGFDSLSATFLRLRIVGALRASKIESIQKAARTLKQNLVYSYPIIQDLASHVVSVLTPGRDVQKHNVARHSELIEEMIKKYSFGLDGSSMKSETSRVGPAVVLLTGSTGNLGSEILAALLADDRVERIYAFNRPSQGSFTIEQRHFARFKERGLRTDLLEATKLFYVSGDATQPNLGLEYDQYSNLSITVNIIIHNAWKLNFNLSLPAFEPHIQGTRHLVDLLKSGPNAGNSRFLFTSSVSSAQSWPKSKGPYPEEVILDASFAVGSGYGEGKYVTERILATSGLQAMSLRIGQISGGTPKGAWAPTDWVPILVKSSVTIGSLPDIEGVISWIPMDAVAAAIVEAALEDKTLPIAANLVHPRSVEAKKVVSSIQAAIADMLGKHLDIVPFHKWLSIIEQSADAATANVLIDIPAIKLLDFFRLMSQGNDEIVSSNSLSAEAGSLTTFLTDKMLLSSHAALSKLPSIGREDAMLWVKFWQELDFLN